MLIILIFKYALIYFVCLTDQPLLALLIFKWIMYFYTSSFFFVFFFATHRNYYYRRVEKWEVYVIIVIYIINMFRITLITRFFKLVIKSQKKIKKIIYDIFTFKS
jgi:hypothetical protein